MSFRSNIFGQNASAPGPNENNFIGYSLSLHQLNPNQTDALTLRRLSDSATEIIGFSNGFLNTAQAESFLNGSEGTVVRWNESNGNDMVSVASNREPKLYDVNGIITVNGTPSVKFLTSYMQSVQDLSWTEFFSTYIVCRQNVAGVRILVNADHDGDGKPRIGQILRDRYESVNLGGGTGGTTGGVTTAKIATNPAGLHFFRSERRKVDNTYNIHVNEFSDINANDINNGSGLKPLWLGGFKNNYHADGYISELQILMNSEAEDTTKRDEIKSRYNLTF